MTRALAASCVRLQFPVGHDNGRGGNTLLCHLCDPGDFVVCGGLRLGGRCRRRDGAGRRQFLLEVLRLTIDRSGSELHRRARARAGLAECQGLRGGANWLWSSFCISDTSKYVCINRNCVLATFEHCPSGFLILTTLVTTLALAQFESFQFTSSWARPCLW